MDGEIAVPLKGSGQRQERALTPSVIHSTKVANCKETSRLLGKSGTAKISVSRTIYSVFFFLSLTIFTLFCVVENWKAEQRRGERCRARRLVGMGLRPIKGNKHNLIVVGMVAPSAKQAPIKACRWPRYYA